MGWPVVAHSSPRLLRLSLGFIFGIPRTLGRARSAPVATVSEQGGRPAAESHALLAANTNLEHISDWLTTLLVGATLVQVRNIAEWISGLGKNLNLTTGGEAANDARKAEKMKGEHV